MNSLYPKGYKIDCRIAALLAQDAAQILSHPLLLHLEHPISFGWSSFLVYLGCGALLSDLPAFDETTPLFAACVATMHANEEKEVLLYMYDRLFAEVLNQVRNLPELQASFLLQKIQDQRETASFMQLKAIVSPALAAIEGALIEKESHTMHDVILYLAWDRMCVCLARLFDHSSTNPKFLQGIRVFKECLIESYQHIAQKKRTSPSIFRMMEALFFYHMREENLKGHTEAEWALLSHYFPLLKAQDALMDVSYIDDALNAKGESSICHWTSDSPEIVGRRHALAQWMMDKIQAETPQWEYRLRLQEIVYF